MGHLKSTSLLVALIAVAAPVESPKLTAVQQEVVDAYKTRTEASNTRDMATWSRYIAEDCIFSTDDGELHTKAEVMRHLQTMPAAYDHTVNPRDFIVNLYGETAVLNLRFTTHEQFTDSDIVTEMRATETYVRREGTWLLVARQWGSLPVNFHQQTSSSPASYKDFAGQFEWRPGLVETITLKDGKLWSKLEGGEDEYLPLGTDRFFVKSDLGTVGFVRSAGGNVTGFTYYRIDGQQIHVRKLNR